MHMTQNTLATISDSDLLARVIVPDEPSLSEHAARALLAIRFPLDDVERMNELAEKNRLGSLTEAEQLDLEAYTRVGSLVNLLKAKAWNSLRKGPSS
jgi:hypothetical protein